MSPYENRLLTEGFRRVGLVSRVKPGHESTVADLTEVPPSTETRLHWDAEGMANVSLNSVQTTDGTVLFTYLEFAGTDDRIAAGKVNRDPWFQILSDHLEPHPRAENGCDWLPMETINIIGPTCPSPRDDTTVQRMGMVTQLDPAAELSYRTLHQTNWPGVVDQMARSNRRYWVTFLIEFGEELWLFTYTEYVGTDIAADDAAMGEDPVTQRWWKHTQPCLKPITDQPGGWTTMQSLTETAVTADSSS